MAQIKRILNITTEPSWGSLLREDLIDLGFASFHSTSFKEALGLISAEEYDLILIDADDFDQPPAKRGKRIYDFYFKIRTKKKDLPIVIHSIFKAPFTSTTEFDSKVYFAEKSSDLKNIHSAIFKAFNLTAREIEILKKKSYPLYKITIFISYCSEDYKKAHAIHDTLLAAGYNPWLDREKLVGGHDWTSEIEKAIGQSDFFLACLSKNSMNKAGYVQKELKLGLEIYDKHPWGNIFLIPVRLEQCEVPQRFKKIQWVDLFQPKGVHDLLNAITVGCTQRRLI